MLPSIHSPVFRTPKGTPYLRTAGVVMVSRPEVSLAGIQGFLEGFDTALQFREYLSDPELLPASEELCKLAGQLCYLSFGPKRSMNADAAVYHDRMKDSGHGSVYEHANYTFLLYGLSRSMTHELVRHRAGFAYSQVSQRYAGGKTLRFVERPEYAADGELHVQFEDRIDRIAADYEAMTDRILGMQTSGSIQLLSDEQRTDKRKKVRQTARSLLPNETEAPILTTANVRSWRHFLEMRASEHAETEIRAMAMRIYQCLVQEAPILFGDYEPVELVDGSLALKTRYRKV